VSRRLTRKDVEDLEHTVESLVDLGCTFQEESGFGDRWGTVKVDLSRVKKSDLPRFAASCRTMGLLEQRTGGHVYPLGGCVDQVVVGWRWSILWTWGKRGRDL